MKTVVLISGKINSGKNTFADLLRKYLGDLAGVDSFAAPLKEMCAEAFASFVEHFNASYCPPGEIIHPESWYEKKTEVTRRILQIVGTEIVRKVDSTYWIRQTIKRINRNPASIVLITDWRFPDEMERLQDFHLTAIRVERTLERREGFNDHISETALDNFKGFDSVIENTTMEKLDACAYELANQLREEQMP